MKITNTLLALFLIPFGVFAQKGYIIHGKITGFDKPTRIFLKYQKSSAEFSDSVFLNNGSFTFKGHVNSPTGAYLAIIQDTSKSFYEQGRGNYFNFYIENSDITITSKDSLSHSIVKGSKSNEDQDLLNKVQRPYRRVVDSITKVYYALTPEQRKDSTFRANASKIMIANQHDYNSATKNFICTHLNSYISLEAFKVVELAYNFNPDTCTSSKEFTLILEECLVF